jgi:hypothetical protein
MHRSLSIINTKFLIIDSNISKNDYYDVYKFVIQYLTFKSLEIFLPANLSYFYLLYLIKDTTYYLIKFILP